jgi:hypothetical protein
MIKTEKNVNVLRADQRPIRAFGEASLYARLIMNKHRFVGRTKLSRR